MDEVPTYELEAAPDRERTVELRFDDGTVVADGFEGPEDVLAPFEWDDRVEAGRVRAVDYRRGLGLLLKAGFRVEDRARAYTRLDLELQADFEPYDHQREGLEAWLAAEQRGTVVLPTGSGKTHVARLAADRVERTTLVVVPTIDLMNQWARSLEEGFGLEVGLVGGGSHEVADLTVATYDSAAMHMEHFGDAFGFVVFDEVHHLPSDFYREAAESSIAPFRLGLTATPERSDGRQRDLPELVGPICYRQSIDDLAGDVLASYEVRRRHVGMTEEDYETYRTARRRYRDFVEDQGIRMSRQNGWMRFLAATNRSERGRKALEAYRRQKQLAMVNRAKMAELFDLLEEHRDDPVLVFTHDNRTVWAVSERALVPSITHQTGADERREILDRFREGTYRTVVTSKVLNEGVDVPRARIGIVLSGSGSVREHVQRLGRILRQWEGEQAILYELVTDETVEESVSRRRREHDAYQ